MPTKILVQVLFNEPIEPASISGVTLTPAGGSPLAVTKSLSNANQTLTLVPPGLLQPSTFYTLSIAGIADVANNGLASTVTQTFTTGPGVVLVGPTAVPANLTNGATGVSRAIAPAVTISAPINPLTLVANSFLLLQSSNFAQVAGTLSVSADGLTVTFTPTASLGANTTYRYTSGGVLTDLAGNAVVGFNIAFTTGN